MQREFVEIRRIFAIAVALAAFVVAGCSTLSASSKSLSQVVFSPITSSSDSSNGEEGYETDVADYTAAYLKSGGDASRLRREIARVAEKNGITDWQNDRATYEGLGRGLAKAGLSRIEVDAYARNLADTDQQASWIRQGYDALKRGD